MDNERRITEAAADDAEAALDVSDEDVAAAMDDVNIGSVFAAIESAAEILGIPLDTDPIAVLVQRSADTVERLDMLNETIRSRVDRAHHDLALRIDAIGGRIESLHERLNDFNTRIDKLRDVIAIIGEQQQQVTDETERAKVQLQETIGSFMSNPVKAVPKIMQMMKAAKNQPQLPPPPDANEIERNGNDAA